MPTQTWTDGKNVYSIDMMFYWLKEHGMNIEIQEIAVNDLLNNLEYDNWGNGGKGGDHYSAIDVLSDPKKEKFKGELKRIEKADLRFPIIIFNGWVVDGIHRLAKAQLLGNHKIKAVIFSKKLIDKFVIGKYGSYETAAKLTALQIKDIFMKRFKEKLEKK